MSGTGAHSNGHLTITRGRWRRRIFRGRQDAAAAGGQAAAAADWLPPTPEPDLPDLPPWQPHIIGQLRREAGRVFIGHRYCIEPAEVRTVVYGR